MLCQEIYPNMISMHHLTPVLKLKTNNKCQVTITLLRLRVMGYNWGSGSVCRVVVLVCLPGHLDKKYIAK